MSSLFINFIILRALIIIIIKLRYEIMKILAFLRSFADGELLMVAM